MPQIESNVMVAKYAGSRSGSKILPSSSGRTSTCFTVPSLKVSLQRVRSADPHFTDAKNHTASRILRGKPASPAHPVDAMTVTMLQGRRDLRKSPNGDHRPSRIAIGADVH